MKKRKIGQAMVEFLCGLVGICVIISVLLQINVISREHMIAVLSARSQMGDLLSYSSTGSSDADYLSGWSEGTDEYQYSEDDESETGSAVDFTGALATAISNEAFEVDFLAPYFQTNLISDICEAGSDVVDLFGVNMVEEETDSIELLPFVRNLVYDADDITLKYKVYMPWINVD
jgi:hypothetical protein